MNTSQTPDGGRDDLNAIKAAAIFDGIVALLEEVEGAVSAATSTGGNPHRAFAMIQAISAAAQWGRYVLSKDPLLPWEGVSTPAEED